MKIRLSNLSCVIIARLLYFSLCLFSSLVMYVYFYLCIYIIFNFFVGELHLLTYACPLI